MHISVFPQEIKNLVKNLNNPLLSIDFTFGGGGHTKIILDNCSTNVMALDRDVTTTPFADIIKNTYGDRFNFHVDISYRLKVYTNRADFILGDLGLSQMQLQNPRGFSYKDNSDLDMQMGVDSLGSLSNFLKSLSEYKIGEILREYGEEPQWRKISNAITNNRMAIHTTKDLKDLIAGVVKKDLNKALSRCFQAFRIFINQELLILDKTLEVAYEVLTKGGVLALITFHSLEDRIVKTFFKKNLIDLQLILPQEEEIMRNPSCRSAKLRIGVKP